MQNVDGKYFAKKLKLMILTGYFNTLSIKNIKKKVVDLEALSVNITY